MSFYIFTESNIAPATLVVNMRNVLCDVSDYISHPHRIGFFVQTTTLDPLAGAVTARVRYEDELHHEHNYENPPITLTSDDPAGGGFQAHDVFDAYDKFFSDSSGAFGTPYGMLQFELDLGGPAGSALITYACMLEKIDGSSTVYTYP